MYYFHGNNTTPPLSLWIISYFSVIKPTIIRFVQNTQWLGRAEGNNSEYECDMNAYYNGTWRQEAVTGGIRRGKRYW